MQETKSNLERVVQDTQGANTSHQSVFRYMKYALVPAAAAIALGTYLMTSSCKGKQEEVGDLEEAPKAARAKTTTIATVSPTPKKNGKKAKEYKVDLAPAVYKGIEIYRTDPDYKNAFDKAKEICLYVTVAGDKVTNAHVNPPVHSDIDASIVYEAKNLLVVQVADTPYEMKECVSLAKKRE